MNFLLGPLKLIGSWILQIVVDKLYQKLMDMWKIYKEKEDQKKIEAENLAKIKAAKDESEKLKAQIDLLNGKH